jgi:hypothetical protein
VAAMSWLRHLFAAQTWCWHLHRLRERRPDGTLVLVCESCLHEVVPGIR